MRPTSPAHANKSDGFTFMEVMVALVMASILVGVTCTALVTALNAERLAGHMRTAGFMAQELTTLQYRAEAPTNLIQRVETEWVFGSNTVVQTSEETNITWQVWTLSPLDRPSWSVEICFAATEGEEGSEE